ncbi:hypothetical protein PCANC_04554 [Puccinia coronata f. sp. avenae]|uniref:Uncharacterized protein n=1 Tax=Puccinia coronata f. sp. avenae TaxID=200324 RepID=A0A2N5T1I1_9BASI|nr:hypothetical protein PCANC_09138 [Puccinia coronata f. sp. avenae]PLW54218.1 hypothetical protein PCANC_04554 [Puccinia coronata f. sp. avenae]
MTARPPLTYTRNETSTANRRASSPYPNERTVEYEVELRILSHSAEKAGDPPIAEEELGSRSVGLINSYLSHSDDRAVTLVLNLSADHQSASRDQECADVPDPLDWGAPVDSLGEDALEHCIPPPYRSPVISTAASVLTADQSHTSSTGLHKNSIRDQRARLRIIKPWHRFTSLSTAPDPTYDLKRMSDAALPDSQRRGFWLIPVWKASVTSSDYYGRFGHLISLPTWSHPSLSPPTTSEIQNYSTPAPIIWNPTRLSLLWKVICIICEKRRLGDVSATAVASSHVKDILPYTQPIPANSDQVSLEPEDAIGDHLRIWSSLQTSLVIRRVISDITIKSAIQAHGTNKESSVPFLDFRSTREDLEKQAGDYEDKWLKDCVFMWLDDGGIPRGYG